MPLEPHRWFSCLNLWTWLHRASAAGFLAILVLGGSDWFPWLKGSITGTQVLGAVPFVDPLAGVEVLFASRTATTMLVAGLLLTVVIAVLPGRVFCGWLCPLGLLFDLNDVVRTWLARALGRFSLRLPSIPIPKTTKYWLLLVALIISLISAMPIFTVISPINIVALSVIYGPGIELVFVVGLVAFEYVSPRAFCRSLCPLGALYCLLGKFGIPAVRIQPKRLCHESCRVCSISCPMAIPVQAEYVARSKTAVHDAECTRCGTCIDRCPTEMLSLRVRNPFRNG